MADPTLMPDPTLLALIGVCLFGLGLLGVIARRNLLVVLMCTELMLNGAVACLVAFSALRGGTAGPVLVFLVFVVAAAEIAIAIPVVLQLVRQKRTLDLDAFSDLRG